MFLFLLLPQNGSHFFGINFSDIVGFSSSEKFIYIFIT